MTATHKKSVPPKAKLPASKAGKVHKGGKEVAAGGKDRSGWGAGKDGKKGAGPNDYAKKAGKPESQQHAPPAAIPRTK